MGKHIDNKTVTDIFNQVHNIWWKKWRDRVPGRHDPEWAIITAEAKEILDRYGRHPLAVHLVQDLLDELEERSRNAEEEERG